MLRRLESIKECGIFKSYRWDTGLRDFARINVIYGPNGSGKTCLSGALDGLRNASDGEGYRKLSVTYDDLGRSKTTNGSDNSFFDRIHVFSEHYVGRSHNFTPAKAEMSAVLTIGEQAVDAQEKLERLHMKRDDATGKRGQAQAAERTANQAVEGIYGRVSQQVVDAASKAGGRYHSRSNFSAGTVRTAFEQDHTAWVKLAANELQEKTGIINADKAESLPDDALTVSIENDIQVRISAALATTPTTIILDTLKEHPDAAAWVDQGRHHHEGVDTCIFCGSPLTAERRSLIDQHFSNEVQKLQSELRAIMTTLDLIKSKVDASRRAIPNKGLFFEDLRNKYDEPAKALADELAALNLWAGGVKPESTDQVQ